MTRKKGQRKWSLTVARNSGDKISEQIWLLPNFAK